MSREFESATIYMFLSFLCPFTFSLFLCVCIYLFYLGLSMGGVEGGGKEGEVGRHGNDWVTTAISGFVDGDVRFVE